MTEAQEHSQTSLAVAPEGAMTPRPPSHRPRPALEAMILAGGKGTRLHGVVADRPKPMAEVAGRPFIEWLLPLLYDQEVKRVILCTGHLGELVEAHFGDGARWGMEVQYSRDPFPLGTAGAVRHALSQIRGDRFLVLNGDSYCRCDIQALADAHVRNGAKATLWLAGTEDGRRFGSVVLEGCHGQGSQTRFIAFGDPQTRLAVNPEWSECRGHPDRVWHGLPAHESSARCRCHEESRAGCPRHEHSQTSLAVAPVQRFLEKSPDSRPGLVSAGVYLIERQAAEAIPTGRSVSLETGFFPGLVGRGLFAVASQDPFIDIGTPESYAVAGRFIAEEAKAW